MTLVMAPGVYQTFVTEIVRSTLFFGYDMIRFYVFSRYKWDGTQSASVPLFLVQHQSLFRVGFPSHLALFPFLPVCSQGGGVGGMSPCDLCVASSSHHL